MAYVYIYAWIQGQRKMQPESLQVFLGQNIWPAAPGQDTPSAAVCYGTCPIYRRFVYWKWWFSRQLLNYQKTHCCRRWSSFYHQGSARSSEGLQFPQRASRPTPARSWWRSPPNPWWVPWLPRLAAAAFRQSGSTAHPLSAERCSLGTRASAGPSKTSCGLWLFQEMVAQVMKWPLVFTTKDVTNNLPSPTKIRKLRNTCLLLWGKQNGLESHVPYFAIRGSIPHFPHTVASYPIKWLGMIHCGPRKPKQEAKLPPTFKPASTNLHQAHESENTHPEMRKKH